VTAAADSSPPIILTKLGCLDLLNRVFHVFTSPLKITACLCFKSPDRQRASSELYFFWTGKSTVRSAKGKWQRRLQRLFKLANVPKGHPHQFRDTFAVELLLAGVPLDRVSILLGHSSIRITERHYAPWTRSRQEQIEADLKAAWSNDPVIGEVHAGYTAKRAARTPVFSRMIGRGGGDRTKSDAENA
jgi:hypothetical protein